jgi:peptidoglycan/LPS O-acetylase OafA/YrhL
LHIAIILLLDLMQTRNYFPTLDLTRFICCLIVMIPHALYSTLPSTLKKYGLRTVLYTNAETAVYYFFVLSGFVITWSILQQIEKNEGKFNPASFYIRRILRIFPLYYFCIFIGFAVFPFVKAALNQEYNETANFFLCVTFLNNFNLLYNGLPDASILSILWTIAIEQQFYVVWPVLFFFPIDNIRRLQIIVILILISIMFRIFYIHKINVNVHTLGIFSYLAFGGFGALLIHTFPRIKLSKLVKWFSYALLVFILVSGNLVFENIYMAILKPVFLSVIFCIIIIDLSFSEKTIIPIGIHNPLVKLGRISYGLYCYHQMIILLFTQILATIYIDLWVKTFIIFTASLLTTIVVSHISYYYFELKLITFGKNMFNKNSNFNSKKVTA